MLLSGFRVCASALLFARVSANAFLGRDLPHLNLNTGDLLGELDRVLGSVHRMDTEARASKLEERMRSTFQALPRDTVDRLEPAAVRYLLHRYFVDRHGWYVLGFDTEGEAWNSSSPTAVLGAHVGEDTQNVFEDRLGSQGLSLHEVSLLAATLESFVHMETTQRLHGAFRVLGLSKTEEHATEEGAVLALDTYMLMYVLGLNHTSVTTEEVNGQWKDIDEIYPTWNETKKWIREVRKEVVSSRPEQRNSFDTLVLVVEEIGDRYGRWQDQECLNLKESLLKLEAGNSGRVPLAAFYEAALNGMWQFSESQSYLRQLGSLDETVEGRAAVVIPNYVNSPTNCVASSKFYSVCCINECEAILGHLERTVTAPTATPSRIVEIVEMLPSATVDAPRKLPEKLVGRLEEIASHHGGHIPFHARLFNQWLHHAYPRECPFPHLSGTSKPISPERWMDHTGETVEADAETMRWHVENGRTAPDEFLDELPWAAEEEFFIPQVGVQPSAPVSAAKVLHRGVAFCAMVISALVVFLRLLSTAKEGMISGPQAKVFV